jgi:diguanylate cyclase (GGDEF)-like protein/PAS domain S-box-containing protein
MKNKPTYEELEKRISELERVVSHTGILQSQVLHRISVPTFAIDKYHEVIYWNTALEKLTGISQRDVVGTNHHWQAFYPLQQPTMADFVVDNMHEDVIASFYEGKYRKSALAESAYETEDYFPLVGKWLSLTASPISNVNGDIIGAVETILDITEKKKLEGVIREKERFYKESSMTDALTKLYNSRKFFSLLTQETQRANRYKHPLSLILLDVDNFKDYNDQHGHLEGDNALRVLAAVTKKALRGTDTAFRYGGEEFTVLLPETTCEDAMEVAERILKNVENSILSKTSPLKNKLTVSVGATGYILEEEITTFLKRANAAMYEAKRNGKNCTYLAE